MVASALDRFHSTIEIAPSGCWLWRGSTNNFGYGMFQVDGTRTYVHRWSFEHFIGPIPKGLTIDHLCRTPGCANPEHLEAVTHQENIRRGYAYKTLCNHGHLLDGVVTRRNGQQHRYCKTCNAERRRKRYASDPAYRQREIRGAIERRRRRRAKAQYEHLTGTDIV